MGKHRIPRNAPWRECVVENAEGCLEWQGYRNPGGYGTRRWAGRGCYLVHRMVYELEVGPIPAGLTIDHLCGNPACCNPQHLEAVTMRENLHRGRGTVGTNARKTHCVHGHPFSEDNTRTVRTKTGGGRVCIECARRRNREAGRRRRAARRAA